MFASFVATISRWLSLSMRRCRFTWSHPLRAERRLGEMMAVTPKAKGTMGQLKGSEDGSGATAIVVSGGVTDTPPEISFAEAGIDKNLAHRVRLLHGKSKEFSGTRIGDVGMVRYGPLTR